MSRLRYIGDGLADEIKETFRKRMVADVTLAFIDWRSRCENGRLVGEMASEIASLSDKIKVVSYDLDKDRDVLEIYPVDKVPALLVLGEEDYGIGFFGSVAGYQIRALVEAIVDVSTGRTDFRDEVRAKARSISHPTHLQLFVTATCRYCYDVARTICKLAIENDKVVADIIMASEFRDLAVKYMVYDVPKLIINEKYYVVGAPEEGKLVDLICSCLEKVSDSVNDSRRCSGF